MQNTSALYKSIVDGEHWFESRIDIDGVESFDETKIVKLSTSISLFQDVPEIGTAVSGEIEAEIITPAGTIPRMAAIRVYVRARNAIQQSEWLPQGVFFIDTRIQSVTEHGESTLIIHGYDAMLKAERLFESETITGDSTDAEMVAEIAAKMGVEVDLRTYDILNQDYTIPLPTGYTMREILGYIASMYVGCFIMTDEGKLRLISLLELPPETNHLIDEEGNAITFGGDRILV